MFSRIYEKSKNSLNGASNLLEARFPGTHKYVRNNKKRVLIISAIVLVIIIFIAKPNRIDPNSITVIPVQSQNLVSAVKSSGKVTSITDLNLSFKTADIVQRINVSVGDKVKQGQILASLESGNENAAVRQALGGLRSAQANLQKVKEGATTEEIRVAQIAYDNAIRDYDKTKRTQETLVENARRAMNSAGLEAISGTTGGASGVAPIISGVYVGQNEGAYNINIYSTGSGSYYSVSGLDNFSGPVDIGVPRSLGKDGLFINFPTGFSSINNNWTVNVPNKASSLYTANFNAYMSARQAKDLAMSQAQSVVDSRKADLDLKLAGARSADLQIAEANVLTAEGVYQNALANLEKKILRAPADGTITRVDIKVGELAESMKPVIVVQDIGKLYIEADVNESSITNILPGQPVDFTIDAFGQSRLFKGSVIQVEPSATITDGIVNYKIKVSIDEKDSLIRPGMNANIVVTTGTKENVIAIPGASIENKDGKKIVLVITNTKNKKYVEREVVTGITGDGNLVEIISGLQVGENVTLVSKE